MWTSQVVQDIVVCNYHLSSFGLTTHLSSSRLNVSWTFSRPPSPNPHLSTLMWLMNAIKPGIKPNPTLRLNTQATGVAPWRSRLEPLLGESSHLRVHPEGYVTTPPWKRTRSNSASVIGGKRYIFVNRPLKKKGWTLQVWGLIPLGWSESSNLFFLFFFQCPLVRTEVKHCPILRIATRTQTGFYLLREAWNCVLSSIYLWNWNHKWNEIQIFEIKATTTGVNQQLTTCSDQG